MAKELLKVSKDLDGHGTAEASVDSMLVVKAKVEVEVDVIAEVEKLVAKTQNTTDDKAVAAVKKIRDMVNAVLV